MPLTIGTESTPSSSSADALLAIALALPTVQTQADQLVLPAKDYQDHTIGVLEKGFVITSTASQYYIAGTDRLLHCIGISIFDPQTGTLAVAHLDVGCEARSIDKVLAAFAGKSPLHIRLFGGLSDAELNSDNAAENTLSITLVKNVLVYLNTQFPDTQFILLSADIFNKTHDYKNQQKADVETKSIGFAIDCRNGCVLNPENSPYSIKINNCGIHSERYKEGPIAVRMHTLFGFPRNELSLRFDGRASNPFQEIESRIQIILCNAVKQAIQFHSIIKLYPLNELEVSLDKAISDHYQPLFSSAQECLTCARDYVCYLFYKQAHPNLLNSLHQTITDNYHKLMHFIMIDKTLVWLNQEIPTLVTQELTQQSSTSLDAKSASRFLSQMNCGLQLCDELQKHRIASSESFISVLMTCQNIEHLEKTLQEWHQRKLTEHIEKLALNIASIVKDQTRKDISSTLRNYIIDQFSTALNRLNIDKLDLRCQQTLKMINLLSDKLIHAINHPEKQLQEKAEVKYCCIPSTKQKEVSIPLNISQVLDESLAQWIIELCKPCSSGSTLTAHTPTSLASTPTPLLTAAAIAATGSSNTSAVVSAAGSSSTSSSAAASTDSSSPASPLSRGK